MNEIAVRLEGAGIRVAIVRARFNENVGEAATAACTARLRELGVAEQDITLLSVPGALEAPLALRALAQSGRYHALIALGAVIRGETYHFEIVSNESAAGITRVQLDTGVPVANGILTCETDEQADVRAAVKGRDCAEVAIEMANLLRAVGVHR
ncbi:MAG TPA: 6,7-dimethyl-8-ribityllumazine synthase [Burkholderiales bacterium]|nr:6,7-dimethyl-8-ribityllumazine synthase [Burkholderiales bacterium]